MSAGLVSPVESITLALDRWRPGNGVEVLRSELLDVLASVHDARDPRGRRYPLTGLLAIAVLAPRQVCAGTPGSPRGAATAPAEVLAQLGYSVPAAERRHSSACRRGWIRQTSIALLAVALDGKMLRAARRTGAGAMHLVAVFAHRARLVLGQLAVTEKSNEIPHPRRPSAR